MPAKVFVHKYLKTMDFRLSGNDIKERFKTICESIKIEYLSIMEIPDSNPNRSSNNFLFHIYTQWILCVIPEWSYL